MVEIPWLGDLSFMAEYAMHPSFAGPIARCIADAILVAETGRYLMKRRDDLPTLIFPNEWSLFGGGLEAGETADEALRRELREELALEIDSAEFFTEWRILLPFAEPQIVQIAFYVVPIQERAVSGFVLNEGAEMRLFHAEELMRLPNIVPIDFAAVMLHARRRALFGIT